MNLHPNTAYSLQQTNQRLHERTLRDRRLAHEASQTEMAAARAESARIGFRRGFAVAAATGVLVVAAVGVLA
jgi:hypothetical protein